MAGTKQKRTTRAAAKPARGGPSTTAPSKAAGAPSTRAVASRAGQSAAKPAGRAAGRTTQGPAAKEKAAQEPRAAKAGGKRASAPRAISAPAPRRGGAEAEQGKYVYCIIQSTDSLSFGPIGIGAEPSQVHTVNYGDIAAVVSDTPIEVYDPTRENVLAHERVNEMVMREFTVIPMSFGTVFKTADDIVELLRSAYDAFHEVLVKMQGKLEFGLKVLWDPEAVIRELERTDENVRRLKAQISSEKGSTYFARMQYGRLIDSLLQEYSTRYTREIFEALRDVSVASRANKPIGDKMIMNAAFLVTRDREADFDKRVRALGARLENLTFKYTGPWPPYNFVNIRLKLERAKESE